MKATPTSIPDVVLLEPTIFGDERGFFLESYSDRAFERLGLPTRFVQDNHSRSIRNVLRGIHYQLGTPQGKLVRAIHGEIFDIAVDLRKSSPTFGKWVGAILDDKQRHMLWIPPGFGHGFLVLSETAEVAYKASEFYAPANERSIVWNDPTIGIEWPLDRLTGDPVLSGKDAAGLLLKDAEVYA